MLNIKYAVFDIDGTLLPGDSTISPKMVDILHRLRDQGVMIGFATGRNFHFASEVADQIKGKFYLAICNGSVIFQYPEKKIVAESFLTNHDTEIIRVDLQDKLHPCIVNGTVRDLEKTYTFRNPPVRPPILNFLENQRKDYAVLDSLYQANETKFACLYAAVPSIHIESEIKDFRMKYPNFNFTYIADPNHKGFHWFGLMPANTGKENLLYYFQKQYGAKPDEILAAGDDMNDIGMLKNAGISIAMGSAPKPVKDIAKLTIGTAVENSLGSFLIEKFKLY